MPVTSRWAPFPCSPWRAARCLRRGYRPRTLEQTTALNTKVIGWFGDYASEWTCRLLHAHPPTHNGPMFERYSYRARCLIFMAIWSARRRGGSYIEPEDLLHALIREDRGELPAISAEVFPGADGGELPVALNRNSGAGRRSFFSGSVATNLLRDLHEDTEHLNADARGERREPVPHVDMPISHSLKTVLALVAKAHQDNTKIIEPLDLLAGIVENRDSRLAQLLRDHGVTRQIVAKALDSGS
jgi:ATP-dependent Clp protease ATP-binding subunit ClpA